MAKLRILIEEHLCKTVEVDVPDEIEDVYEQMEYATNKARDMYYDEEIVLGPEDHNGVTLYEVQTEYGDTLTEWTDL